MAVGDRWKDITGEKYNHLTAVKYLHTGKYGAIWRWDCDCGEFYVESCVAYVRHGYPKSCGCHKMYKRDSHFFDVIDTEEKAYWLGFIAADGCITNRDRITIPLATVDHSHLVKLNNALKHEGPIYVQETRSIFCIGDTKLVNALKRCGLTERKSLTYKPYYDITPLLTRHYWRGLFDGDGCIRIDRGSWHVDLPGSYETVDAFAKWVRLFTYTKAKVKPQESIWRVFFGGNKLAPTILTALYEGSTVYLDRKYALYQQMIQELQWKGEISSEIVSTVNALTSDQRNLANGQAISSVHPAPDPGVERPSEDR